MASTLERFDELSIETLDEGKFLPALTAGLRAAAAALAGHVAKHGHMAEGGKAVLTAKIELVAPDNIGDDLGALNFTIVARQHLTLPKAPPRVGTAIMSRVGEGDGHLTLIARASGPSSGDPRQHKLCTDDGRPIDPNTGEAAALDGGQEGDGA